MASLSGRRFCVTGDDVWSSLLVLPTSGPSHAFAGEFDSMSIMNEAVQDSVGVDAAIRGHVFCSFLALAMQKCLEDLSRQAGIVPEWKTASARSRSPATCAHPPPGPRLAGRTDASKPIADLFCHAHIALPPSAIRIGRVALRSNCISACNFDPPSYGDAAIIAASRALGCREVLSEKMSHGREVERITIGSPFR